MKPIEAHSTSKIKAKVTREEQAAHELDHTDFSPGTRVVLVVFFLAVMLSVPLAQFCAALRQPERITQLTSGLRALVPDWARVKAAKGVVNTMNLLPPSSQIKKVEDDWEQNSVVGETILPPMQSFLLTLGQGNEKAYLGREGWLYYRADLDYVTGRGFLDPRVLKRRATTGGGLKAPQPDPIQGILHFRDQLAARGITLIVMPMPVKPSIYPEFFSNRYTGSSQVVQNPSFDDFKRQLSQAGVAVFDPAALLVEAKARTPGQPLYLKTDTHWTPPAMEMTAATLASFARKTVSALPALQAGRFTTLEKSVEALGDVALMFKLPAKQRLFPDEQVRVREVLEGNRYWRPAVDAEVLFLGDSFANIFSLEPMGWGKAAGFVEHLSLALGLPVDALCRNDAGSYATREMLAKELQRGQDRLAGKKLVIWEFAERELACGDWKLLPMTLGEKRDVGMYVPAAGKTVEVRGVVREASPAPRPGSVPYKDHIVMVHLAEIESKDDPAAVDKEAVVFIWSMRDNVSTAASRYRPGDVVNLRLRPWADVSSKYEAINRSELEDPEILLAEPAWGE
jgi:alginate O-acetyltransferase complex protein AlgJ